MTNTLIVAVDGSPGCERALDTAIDFAKAMGAGLTVAHVIEWSAFSFHTPEELAERHRRREEELERAKDVLVSPAAAKVEGAGLSCDTVVRHGNPAETLVTLANELGAAQIFVGRKGQSKINALLYGSVAGSLVQISSVPVTVVP